MCYELTIDLLNAILIKMLAVQLTLIITSIKKSFNSFQKMWNKKVFFSRFEVHPRFNSRQLTNDIALMWIKNKYNQVRVLPEK